MEPIFEAILRASFSGSVIIAVILVLRLVLRKTPKRFICLLWLLAMVRLLVPFSIESPLSLQPDPARLSSVMQPEHSSVQMEVPPVPAVPDTPVVTMPPAVTTPGTSIQIPSYEIPDVVIGDADISQPDIVTIDTSAIAAAVWAAVAWGFLAYTAVSYFLLKRKVRDAVQVDEGIFECSAIDSPFLLGYIKPNIYLPAGLPLQDLDYILAHEKAHIRRMDNWTKLVMFLCLALHWFNPLVWAAYILLCRDMEMACDEQVVRHMTAADRKAYSGALLNCAAGHRLVSACPVAFGEVSVKQRILKVLNYRKPGFWISIITIIAILFVAVCFLTNPSPDQAALLEQCRTALEEFQSTGCYHLLYWFEDHSGSWLVLDAPDAYDDWNGNNRQYLFIDTSEEGATHRLHFGEQYLQRDITYAEDGAPVDSGWYSSDWSGSSSFTTDTVADLVWEDYTITVKGSRSEQTGRDLFTTEFVDATIVTLHIKQNDREYDREFYLDEEGKLFRIDNCFLLTNDQETVQDMLNQCTQEATADMQVYLLQCVQALQEILQADTFYMDITSIQISEPSQLWIRNGADQLVTRYENDILTMTLEYGGKCFRREKTYCGSYLIGDSGWYPTEAGVSQEDYPWFLTMDWDNSEAFVLQAYVTEYDQVIEVLIPEQYSVLRFHFDIETGEMDHMNLDWLTYDFNVLSHEAANSHLELHYRLAAGLEAEPESPAVQKCRDAIEFLQTGSYTIIQNETTGKQSYTRLKGFKAGDDLLIQYTGTDRGYLRLDGKDYALDAAGWKETDLGDFSGVEEWLIDDLRWDSDRFFVQYDIGDITVAVADESLPKGFYILEFSFDETGKLASLKQSYDTGSPGDWSTHTTIITVLHPDPESTTAYIRQYYDNTSK